jgi:energy-coupling factor transport system substrate-specific component
VVGRALRATIYASTALIGLVAFIYPFLLPMRAAREPGVGHLEDAPLVTAALVGLALVAIVVELQGRSMRATTVAALGLLAAIVGVLRFVALTLPGLGGFSPVFAPIVLGGYVFGARFGFLLGALGLLVSALVTGGVGPWLAYQMFAAGWMGATAGWLGWLLRDRVRPRFEVAALGAFGFGWGLLFGAIMNLYFWPFAVGPADQYWTPGVGPGETVARFAVFYVATSLWWDLTRSVGNLVLLLLVGPPLVRALRRFQRRFDFVYTPST